MIPFFSRIIAIFVILASSSSLVFTQNWQADGFLPSDVVAYDQSGNERTVITHYNVYKSTDSGATWQQQLSAANAPFLGNSSFDFPRSERGNFQGFYLRRNFIFDNQIFLTANTGTSFSSRDWEIYSSPDDGATLTSIFQENDAFGQTATYGYDHDIYRVNANTYLIRFQSNGIRPSGDDASVYQSTDGGATWNLLTRYAENNFNYAGSTSTEHWFLDATNNELIAVNRNNGNQRIVNSPADAIRVAELSGGTLRLLAWDGNSGQLRAYSSTNSGASYSAVRSFTLPTSPIRNAQLLNGQIFVGSGTFSNSSIAYRLPFNSLSNPVALNSGFGSDPLPFREMSDGNLTSIRSFFSSPKIRISSDNWTTVENPSCVPYALAAMPNFNGTYFRFNFNQGQSTTDGCTFTDEFQLSSSAFDIRYFSGAAYADSYSDPFTTGYLTSDGMNASTTDIDIVGAGGNLYSERRLQNQTTIVKSSDNGATWNPIPNSYFWQRNVTGDEVTGDLYGMYETGGGFSSSNINLELARSTDEGVTWEFLPGTNFPLLNGDDYTYNQFSAIHVYNGYWFVKTDSVLRYSTDGGATFLTANTPFTFSGAKMYILDGKLMVQTPDERLFSVDINQWLGTAGGGNLPGATVDIELSVSMNPPNPAPFTFFDVTYTVTNKGAITARNVGIQSFIASSVDAILQGGATPVYSGSITNRVGNTLAPNESGSVTYPYFRQNGAQVTPWGQIIGTIEPDIDSQPGNVRYPAVTEDDEAIVDPNLPQGCNPDLTAPVFNNCPANIAVVATNGISATASWTPPTATDACPGNVQVSGSSTPGFFFPIGTTTVTYTATDAAGNTAQCSFSIVVTTGADPCANDQIAPTFNNCPADIQRTTTGNTAVANWSAPTTNDNCPGPITVTTDANPGDAFSIGTTTVTYTATDAAGNTATCSFTVTVTAANNPCNPDDVAPTVANCPNTIQQTINGQQTTINWTAPTFNDACPGAVTVTSTHQPGDVFSLGTTTVTYTATDAAGNVSTCAFDVVLTGGTTGGNDIDLELSAATLGTPTQWNFYSVEFVVTNNSPTTATNIEIEVPITAGIVYEGGNESSATAGSFDWFAGEQWTIPTLAANASATLTLNYFLLAAAPPVVYGQVVNADQTDSDSTPANGTPPTPNEDDEANSSGTVTPPSCSITATVLSIDCDDRGTPSGADDNYTVTFMVRNGNSTGTWTANNGGANPPFTGTYGVPYVLQGGNIVSANSTGGLTLSVNIIDDTDATCMTTASWQPPTTTCSGAAPQPDLVARNLNLGTNTVASGALLNYTFTLSNRGAGDATGGFSIKAYLSANRTLDANDIQDGLISTGNLAANASVTTVNGQSTIPASLNPGDYYLILVVDADNDISESNEGNNTLVSAQTFTVTGTTGAFVDLRLEINGPTAPVSIYNFTSVDFVLTNNGTAPSNSIRVDAPLVTGLTYQGGDEFSATAGTYQPYGNQEWRLPSLAPGASATLTVNYFVLNSGAIELYAEVTAASGNDINSTPGNGTCCTPNENDEAAYTLTVNGFRPTGLVKPLVKGMPVQVLNIYPNPVANGEVNLLIQSNAPRSELLQISNALGQIIHQQQLELNQGENYLRINTTDYRDGMYFVLFPERELKGSAKSFVVSER